MSFCTECGAEIVSSNEFCVECGHRVSASGSIVESGHGCPESKFIPVTSKGNPRLLSDPDPLDDPHAPSKAPLIIAICAVVVALIAIAVAIFVVINGENGSVESESEVAKQAQQTEEEEAAVSDDEPELDGRDTASNEALAPIASSNDAPNMNSEYMLPDSNRRYYSESELQAMSDWELYIARNEIFARLGRGFRNADLRSYFGKRSWYQETKSPEEFDADLSVLNDYERANSELIKSIEQARGSSYLL